MKESLRYPFWARVGALCLLGIIFSERILGTYHFIERI